MENVQRIEIKSMTDTYKNSSGYEIIDSHTHIYPSKIARKAVENIGHFYGYEINHTGESKELLEAGKRHGVRGYLVCAVATSPQQVSSVNTFLLEESRKNPEFYPFGTLHPDMEDPGGAVESLINQGVFGIKLHPDFQRFEIDNRKIYPVYEVLQGRIPILMHMGDPRYEYSHPKQLKRVLHDFPKLDVIAAHLGGHKVWQDALVQLRNENLKYDTCSAIRYMSREEARTQIYALGVENCFFGTDYPLQNYDKEFVCFFGLGFTYAENEKILAKNFKQYIGIC